MQHTKATKSFGTAHGLPIYLAFSTHSSVLRRPKECTLHLIDIF
jgi:hypothetical protein